MIRESLFFVVVSTQMARREGLASRQGGRPTEAPAGTSKNTGSDNLLDYVAAMAITLVLVTMALVIMRVTVVASDAGGAVRQGLVSTARSEAATSERWRTVYQEAAFARIYMLYAAEATALAGSRDPIALSQARQVRQFILPNLEKTTPLAGDQGYRNSDGSINLLKRFQTLESEAAQAHDLNPQSSFNHAELYYAEQFWLTLDIFVFVVALFWLTLALVQGERLRLAALLMGGGLLALGTIGFAGVEFMAFWLRRF